MMTNIKKVTTKLEAETRLLEIAFEFQEALLSFVHDTERKPRTRAQAEALADEIQSLSHFFDPPLGSELSVPATREPTA